MKKSFSQKIWVFSLLGAKPTFYHTWCHDFSWFVPLDDSNPFIDTSLGSIPPSTLHADYTSTPLALAGSSHKDNIQCDHNQSGVVGWFFPRTTPRSINWNMAVFFHWGKNDSGLPKSNKQSNKSIEQINKIMKNQSKFSVFNHFGWQF